MINHPATASFRGFSRSPFIGVSEDKSVPPSLDIALNKAALPASLSLRGSYGERDSHTIGFSPNSVG
jgi:hypothetical protein